MSILQVFPCLYDVTHLWLGGARWQDCDDWLGLILIIFFFLLLQPWGLIWYLRFLRSTDVDYFLDSFNMSSYISEKNLLARTSCWWVFVFLLIMHHSALSSSIFLINTVLWHLKTTVKLNMILSCMILSMTLNQVDREENRQLLQNSLELPAVIHTFICINMLCFIYACMIKHVP